MGKKFIVFLFCLMLCQFVCAELVTVLDETFNINSSASNLASNYPHLQFSLANTNPEVAGGILRFGGGVHSVLFKNLDLSGEFFVSLGIGTITDAPGSNNVHVILGQNKLVFHPGYTPIPGAFRIEGNGGFSNVSMGFVPATDVLHTMEMYSRGDGNFDISIKEYNGSNVYSVSFYNPGSLGGNLGVATAGNLGSDDIGIFDDIIVKTPTVIPEQNTLFLLLFFACFLYGLKIKT